MLYEILNPLGGEGPNGAKGGGRLGGGILHIHQTIKTFSR